MADIIVNMEQRMARVETVVEQLRAEMDDALQHAYESAVAEGDAESAAALARRIRDRILKMSDAECALDRFISEPPRSILLSDWIEWLRGLAAARTNAWGVYRQRLRDLTAQPGFPFAIEWPEKPGDDE